MNENEAQPRLPLKRRGTWRVGRQEVDRPYDHREDGWNKHKLRRNPSVDELIARSEYHGL